MESHHNQKPLVGVGLRHAHYSDALTTSASIDFVEVHGENFLAPGGASLSYLEQVREKYPISIHCTALGLGSARSMSPLIVSQLSSLIKRIDPMLISDHACYTWSHWMNKPVHLGDLLPITYSKDSLQVFADNVNKLQEQLQRQILIENLSNYLNLPNSEMTETEFLVRLTELTGCGLLIDLNNILVSAHNLRAESRKQYTESWLNSIPASAVKEIHLAGHTIAPKGELIIDDHSQPVSFDCWQLYKNAISKFGAVPTLIEWDNNLPDWNTLVAEAKLAKEIANESLMTKIGATYDQQRL